MKARVKRPGQKVRTPMCRKDLEDIGAGLNFDRCALVVGLFGTTFLLLIGLHLGVCCRGIRCISLV